jgi:hypothetical protein
MSVLVERVSSRELPARHATHSPHALVSSKPPENKQSRLTAKPKPNHKTQAAEPLSTTKGNAAMQSNYSTYDRDEGRGQIDNFVKGNGPVLNGVDDGL